jgi:hypothetical protein
MDEAESKAISAKVAEKEAILEQRRQDSDSLARRSNATKAHADQLRLMSRAYQAFVDAGGTTAHFKRLWLEALQETEAGSFTH